ncbi:MULTISPECIES: histidine phosphatase family protein [Priestia]|uniref:Phosphoglycerate mutase family protein n=1 Tax=Priestia megaterium (strain ATCC 12872 / QMB1551) TaxID=545693 RepID=D5E4C3_PRIM1|nr:MULTISPECIES: histidine phosphatase family protein [Priestia]ADE72648.1 phosphoglycerate mutase family protein [Priestia megaterium QM B1551]MBG9930849.1 phosphoglycerate mutase [Priestia aryabhattai]
MKTFILVRHCKAEGQEEGAILTEEGKKEAINLITYLNKVNCKITKIISSPYERAVKTIEPYAKEVGLSIQIDNRLSERRLSNKSLTNWLELLKQTFDDIDLVIEGGESTREATERAINLIREEIEYSKEQNTLLVTHGNLMSLILRYFDESFGFNEWANLTNPDVYRIDIEDNQISIKRLWDPMAYHSI